MKKNILILMATASLLASCHTTKSVVSSTYDNRPENKQPVLERPAWPNYDLHNDRSFAAFSHVQTAPKGQGVWVANEDGSTAGLPNTIYRCKDATYLCLDFTVPERQDWWFWRFTMGSALIDADTGDRYLLQHVEHFPIWISVSGLTVRRTRPSASCWYIHPYPRRSSASRYTRPVPRHAAG